MSDFWEEWNEDRDPALRRMRDVLHPPAPAAPEPRQKALRPPQSAPEPVAAPEPSTGRRERIADLIAHVRAGDLSAVDLLREVLDRR